MELRTTFDNSALDNYRRCPRYYYYRDIRHWVTDTKKTALAFGGAWGKAQDAIWGTAKRGGPADVNEVLDAGLDAWRIAWAADGMPPPEDFDKDLEKAMQPRTPRTASNMIEAYVEERWNLLSDPAVELVDTERAFEVPLNFPAPLEHVTYTGLLDKTLRIDERLVVFEHKTTSLYKVGGPFRAAFTDHFSPNSQIDGYLYAMTQLYPDDDAVVWVDGALVHKVETGFMVIPIEKQLEQLAAWHYDTWSWINRLLDDMMQLRTVDPGVPNMEAFPKNCNSCYAFNTSCPYMDLCRVWANPVGQETPPGFHEEIWNPLDRSDKPPLKVREVV